MVPTSPSATTLRRLVPLATCSGRPRRSSAGSVTEEPLLARVLTKPPTKPATATRTPSSDTPTPSIRGQREPFYPRPRNGRHAATVGASLPGLDVHQRAPVRSAQDLLFSDEPRARSVVLVLEDDGLERVPFLGHQDVARGPV